MALPPALARALELGHPWIYRDHVPRGFSAPAGAWVEVTAGEARAYALWDPGSALALRVYSRERIPDAAFFRERVASALALREALGVLRATDAYRLLHGEGDGVPGVVVDRYGPHLVVSLDSPALEPLVPELAEALLAVVAPASLCLRRRGADPGRRLDCLHGALPPADLVVTEGGLRMRADLHAGQKTGLFLDQRDNRARIGALAAGRRVLNLFGYTGGFSLHAAAGGAASVTTVDVARPAIEAARDNFVLNGLDPSAHAFLAEDVWEYLEGVAARGERFDLVVCDPPSFARSRAQRERALSSYARLHALCLGVVEAGGLYAASSCTTQVGVEAFRDTLAQGARRAGVTLAIVEDRGHPPDHPLSAAHPEGRYLKFLLSRVSPWV